jgi:hypothetical protein
LRYHLGYNQSKLETVKATCKKWRCAFTESCFLRKIGFYLSIENASFEAEKAKPIYITAGTADGFETTVNDEGVMSKSNSAGERIGEGLIRIGAMNQEQVDNVLAKQKSGDKRLFGEIAIDLGYINDQAIRDYLDRKK